MAILRTHEQLIEDEEGTFQGVRSITSNKEEKNPVIIKEEKAHKHPDDPKYSSHGLL